MIITIATIAFAILIGALLLQIVLMFMKKSGLWYLPMATIAAAFILLLVELIVRSIQIEFVALTNTYEALLFLAAMTAFVLVLYYIYVRVKAVPFICYMATILIILFMAVASSPIAPNTVKSPIPALQSGWLLLHVSFSFIGEAFFTFAFGAAIYYLFTKSEEKRKNADRLIRTSIFIGYPIFTAGALLFGAIWAQSAWGRFWGWDPKEIFALVTFLVYTIYLHLRFVKKVPKIVGVWTVILGFALTMFTFFGVNFLLPSFHSYQ